MESADTVFARMLILELEKAGLACSGSGSPALVVLDADSVDPDWEAIGRTPAVVFSRQMGKYPPGVTALLRPFPVRIFLDTVLHLLYGEENGPASLPGHVLTRLPVQLTLEENDEVIFMGEKISLTAQEYALLAYLWKNRGRPVSRDEAIEKVWKYDYTGNSNVVDVYIRYLREKLEKDSGVRLIKTVRGKGYVIE